MGLILELLSLSGSKVTGLLKDIPSYIIKKEKIEYSAQQSDTFFTSLQKKIKDTFKDYLVNKSDGIRIYNNYEWLHIRSSNTEPIIRIIAEARTEDRTRELMHKGKVLINSI